MGDLGGRLAKGVTPAALLASWGPDWGPLPPSGHTRSSSMAWSSRDCSTGSSWAAIEGFEPLEGGLCPVEEVEVLVDNTTSSEHTVVTVRPCCGGETPASFTCGPPTLGARLGTGRSQRHSSVTSLAPDDLWPTALS